MNPPTTPPYRFGTYLSGAWSRDGEPFATHDPAQPATVAGRYAATTPGELEAVMAAAARAQQDWARVPGLERQSLIARYFARIRDHVDALGLAITREMGKPLAEAKGEVGWSLVEADFMLGEAARPCGALLPSWRRGLQNQVVRRPRGVIAAVTPWNYPFLLPFRKIAPALVFGNAIVLKPSEIAPAAACLAAELAQGILPDGLFGIVLGEAAVGRALVTHPRAAGVTFTGSVATGRAIYQLAAQNLAEVSLELGGKNPIVVHDTRDLSACLDDIVGGATANAGQRCTSISRVLVRRPLVADVEAGLIERMGRIVVGPGLDPKSQLGPMAMQPHRDKVAGMIDAGRREGARVAAGRGTPPAGYESGYFVQPTVLCGVTPQMTVAREEIFGPVVSVLGYDELDEALAIVNGVEYGLAASIYSDDPRAVRRFTEEAEAGMLHVNHQTVGDPNMPFVGVKASGVGACSVGQSAAGFYTTEHAVYLRVAP